MPFIEIRDMYKIYYPPPSRPNSPDVPEEDAQDTEVHALDGVNLNIVQGESVAIIGHSGSGKSTLMNMLGLLDVCTSGRYILDGQDVSDLSDDELSEIRNRQIGFIFQGFNLIPGLSAQENVELPLIYRGMKREERQRLATEALRQVGLSHRAHHRPAQLSGGQQQRAAIARAVAARPPMILADEPTGNLDSKSGEEVMQILQELHAEGRTVILITHDNEIAAKSRRVVRIHDGRVVEDTLHK